MKLVYLASPYSSLDPEVMAFREQEITRIGARLTYMYPHIVFFLPITQSAAMARLDHRLKTTFDQWEAVDLFLITEKSDEVWVALMDGWKQSVGVQKELEVARKTNKVIRFIDPETMGFVDEWFIKAVS